MRIVRPLLLALCVALSGGSASQGVEPVAEFLAALRQRQWNVEADEYVDLLQNCRYVSDTIKQQALYEKGVTLLEASARSGDVQVRQGRLDNSGKLFQQFLKEQPQHPLTLSARNQLANIGVEKARIEVALVSIGGEGTAGGSSLKTARTLLEDSRGQFSTVEKQVSAELQKLPKVVLPTQPELQATKNRLSAELAQTRLFLAGIDYEIAKTYPPRGKEAKQHLLASAKAFAALFETYRTRSAGLLARVWEGRCYQEMGEFKQAVGCFMELIDMPTTDDTRAIKAQATRYAMECWTDDSQQKFAEAVEAAKKFERDGGGSASDPDTLAIRYLAARAYQGQFSEMSPQDPGRTRLLGTAQQMVTPVANVPGEYQEPARLMLVALAAQKQNPKQAAPKQDPKGKQPPAKQPAAKQPADKGPAKQPADKGGKQAAPAGGFKPAYDKALESIRQVDTSNRDLNRMASDADPAERQALEKVKAEQIALAIGQLRDALALGDSAGYPKELNEARYFLAWLYDNTGRYQEAAVLGEYLAHFAKDGPRGWNGAEVAIRAYVKMAGDGKDPGTMLEAQKLQQLAAHVFKTWPNSKEMYETSIHMMNFHIGRSQFDPAAVYVGMISDKSPLRASAELRLGQALWSKYLAALRSDEAERPPQEMLDKWKQQSQQMLNSGITRVAATGDVDEASVVAAYCLAHSYLESNQHQQAITWLEHPKFGPLTVLKAKDANVQVRDDLAVDCYRLALLAYMGVQPQQLKKAEEAMTSMESLMKKKGDSKADEKLMQVYASICQDMKKQVELLRKRNAKKDLQEMGKTYGDLLGRIAARPGSKTYNTQNWLAASYLDLGKNLEGAAPKLAAEYFTAAATIYQMLLNGVKDFPELSQAPAKVTATRMVLADSYCRAGQFDESLKALLVVLKEQPNNLAAQVQAAKTYQAKGVVDPKAYGLAVNGSDPDQANKKLIWGWAKISLVTNPSTNPNQPKQLTAIFYEARLNLAESRYSFALTLTKKEDKDTRTKVLQAGKQDLWSTYRQDAALGGDETFKQADKLLKQIQGALGDAAIGINEFKDRVMAEAVPDAKTK